MPISAHVEEFTGQPVQRLDPPPDINALCVFVSQDAATYPLLAGIDPYDDTRFNPGQAAALAEELRTIAHHTAEPVSTVARRLLDLTTLLEQAPNRPHHRRLIFTGD